MSYTNGLDKPSNYFNTKLWTGNGSTQSITGVGFQPDFTWIKQRTNTNSHQLFDVIRGATNHLRSNSTAVETTNVNTLTSFDSDGFSIGSDDAVNFNTSTYASWNWYTGATASSNTDGSITSSVSANTTSGFSIVSYTGSASSTVGHGLNSTVDMIILKQKDNDGDWCAYHSSLGKDKVLIPNSTSAAVTVSNFWGTSTPDSNVFGTASSGGFANASGDIIAYCFAEKKGFSKFGSYTGNGSTDGTFVYTGFKPAFLITKRSDTSGNSWILTDNARDTDNVVQKVLYPDGSNAEASSDRLDFLSNGFKQRTTSGAANASGGTYIYMCFSENPFVTSTSVPTTAR